mgnify:FL=1
MRLENRELRSILRARSAEIIDGEGLQAKLRTNRNLRVKLGIDPTTPDLHLGHVVPLQMLRAFQNAGHRAVLIIGDFTGQIGDPSGAATVRHQLTPAQVKRNERTYLSQAGTVLNLRKSELRHNSEWHGRMKSRDLLRLLTHFSLKTVWEREDFQKRLDAGQGVRLHEAMYAVLQAYDSVAVHADVELGGVDQKLNLLAGRELQRAVGQPPQDIVIVPYLLGLDGRQKMSKTAGNTINLRDSAGDMFGKVMSIPDSLIVNYAGLAAWLPAADVARLEHRLRSGENPRDVKLAVAEAVLRLYHGPRRAAEAREEFVRAFSLRVPPRSVRLLRMSPRSYTALELLAVCGVGSKSEGRRLLRGGAVEVDGRVLVGTEPRVPIRRGSVIRVGKKRFFRVR